MRISRTVNINRVSVAGIALALSITVQSGFADVTQAHAPSEVVFNLDTNPDFSHYREQLKAYAKEYNPKLKNSFCIIGYHDTALGNDAPYRTEIYWKEGHKILSWGGGKYDIAATAKAIDLLTDVVNSEDQIAGSTYLVTKKWVSDVIADCNKYGVNITFEH
jgi:hypothetical protein